MIELLTGLSAGVLTRPETSYATATEMKANLQMTFAFITNFRGGIEQAVNDLLYAVDKICNRNDITPMGNYDAVFEWSNSYIENMEARFSELMQAQAVGAIDKAELRAWTMDEDYEKSKERIEKIDSEKPDVIEEVI
ncbi:hypothetical protein MHBO_004443 [Bonamia ostreae]|uniref:Uncharacterized protein n=1 Tax=Bonamia ostreae TaxID=126728 RepID=A0ABV2AU39_9EUKA